MSGKGKPKSEEECSCYAESRSPKACPPIQNVTHPLRYYEFSQEEIKALEECDKESFYHRCLPLSTLFATVTYAAIKYGVFKPNPRFGAFPKVTLAVAVGYFLGKLSYQRACADKLMALPGSYIGQLLRDRRDGKIGGRVTPSGGGGAMLGASASDIYSDAGPGSALDLDLDTDRPPFSDDAYRPDHDGSPIPSPGPGEPAPRPALSYDELRRLNRGHYSDSKQDPYRVEPPSATRPTRAAPPTAPTQPTQPTNRYGDALE